MANWNEPEVDTQYDVFVAEVKARDADAATLCKNDPTNPPTGMVRFNRASNIFQEWSGSAWVDIILAVPGGGTGGSSSGGAIASLGLGSMAYQNSNAVAVTGGTLFDVHFRSAGNPYPNVDNALDLGVPLARWRNIWSASGMVIPYGVDKYVVG